MPKRKRVYLSAYKIPCIDKCKNCKICSHLPIIPFTEQTPIIDLFNGGDGTQCFSRKTSLQYEKEKHSPFLKRIPCQSQSRTPESVPKKERTIPFMA